jgi:two-component system chemotaxis response regulator CheB
MAGDRKVLVSTEAPIGGLRPRADLTIVDAARMFGESLLLVVLSGMGKDGVDGAAEVKRRGGRVLVESEASATAYGTPRAVIEAQLADDILMLDELAEAIVAEAGVWAPGLEAAPSSEQSYVESLKAAGDTTRRLRGL